MFRVKIHQFSPIFNRTTGFFLSGNLFSGSCPNTLNTGLWKVWNIDTKYFFGPLCSPKHRLHVLLHKLKNHAKAVHKNASSISVVSPFRKWKCPDELFWPGKKWRGLMQESNIGDYVVSYKVTFIDHFTTKKCI